MSVDEMESTLIAPIPYAPGGGRGSPVPDVARDMRPDLKREYVADDAPHGMAEVPLALPTTIDDVVRERGRTHYEWMLTDPVVSASVRILKLAILAGGMDLKTTVSAKPGAKGLTPDEQLSDDVVKFCWRCVERCKGWNAFLMGLLGAAALGNKLAEKTFEVSLSGPDKGKLVWKSIKVKPRDAWQFVVDDTMNVLGVLFRRSGGMRAFLSREKVVILTWDMTDSDPRGVSVLRPAVGPHNFKHLTWPELYKHMVQFGSASLVGETAPGVQDEPTFPQKDEGGNIIVGAPLLTAQQDMHRGLRIFYRNGSVFVVPNGARVYPIVPQGDGAVFRGNVELFNREIVQAILLQTRATMEAEHGSKADSETGQDMFGLLVDSGRMMLSQVLRDDCFRQLVALNYGQEVADEFTPLVTFGTADVDRAAQWNAVANLMRSGYFGGSQLEEVDSMMGLPIRDKAADEAESARKMEAAGLPKPGEEPSGEEEEGDEEKE